MKPNQPVFNAILNRPNEWRRLGGSTLAVGVVYAGLLCGLVALSERTVDIVTKIPAKLVVTLFDAPRVAEIKNIGMAGGEAAGSIGGTEGTGPVLNAAPTHAPRPTPSVKTKTHTEAKALPNDKPKDATGAGVEPRPAEPTPAPTAETAQESSLPAVGAASSQTGARAGTGPVGQGGGMGGSGLGTGSGTGGNGVGSGAGNKVGIVSGDTQVLPFMDGMTRPTLVSKVDPTYTREARSAEVQGLILTKCVIQTNGSLKNCRIVKGLPLMDQSVLSAVAQWKYTPVMYQGKPAAVEYLIPVRIVPQ